MADQLKKSMTTMYKERLRASRNLAEPHWDRAIDNYKHYLGRLDVGNQKQNDYPFVSQMVVPVSYETVETIMPRIIGKDPEFTAIAMEPDDVNYEQTVKSVLEMQYHNPKLELLGEPIYLKLQRGVKEELITGNVVYRAFWRRQARKQYTYLASHDRTGWNEEADIQKVLKAAEAVNKGHEVTYSKKLIDAPFLDDFDVKHLPFFWFFPDSSFAETGRMRYKIERDNMTFEELSDEATVFGYDPAVMNDIKAMCDENKSGYTPDIKKDFMQEYNNLFQNITPDAFGSDNDKVPLLIVDKMWMGDRVAVFVNEKYNLTGEEGMPNPYDVQMDPFIYGHDVTIPHSYFSWGEIDAIKRLEDGMTDILNMRFDNLVQAMLNFWVYNPNLMANGDEFVPVPSSLTAVTDVDRAVRMLSGKDVTPTAFKESDEIYKIISRVTGSNDYTKGIEGDSVAGRTYGGMRLVQEAANARFIVKSRLFESLTLKSMGYFMLEMSRQFMNKDRVQRITGSSGDIKTLTAKAGDLKSIKGMFDIKIIPNSSRVIDEQAEAMKLNAVADRFVSEKGPFKDIPNEVYDKFLLKYLQGYGITDAIYWVKEIQKQREEIKKQQSKVTDKASAIGGDQNGLTALLAANGGPGNGDPNAGAMPMPGGAPAAPIIPTVPTTQVLQPDQGPVTQPSPMAQILNGGALPGTGQ